MTEASQTIAVLSPTFPPTICGVGGHSAKLVQALAHQYPAIRWTIITSAESQTGQAPAYPFEGDNIDLLPAISAWHGGIFLKQMERLLQQYKPDKILLQYAPTLFHPWALNRDLCQVLYYCHQQKIPLYLILHELKPVLGNPLIQWLSSRQHPQVLRQMTGLAQRVFLSTPSRMATFVDQGASGSEQLIYLPVSSNIDVVPSTPEERETLRSWSNATHKKLLVFWGRLDRSKQLSFIISALKRLYQQKIAFQAVYIGPDELNLEIAIEQYCPELRPLIHQTGSLPEDEISLYLQTADVVLCPFEEGASTRRSTLMAALQHGVPLVTTLGPDTDTLLQACPAVDFCTNEANFAEAVLKACQQPVNPEDKLTRQAFFKQHFAWEHIGDIVGQAIV